LGLGPGSTKLAKRKAQKYAADQKISISPNPRHGREALASPALAPKEQELRLQGDAPRSSALPFPTF
jgi:hypothetical protein